MTQVTNNCSKGFGKLQVVIFVLNSRERFEEMAEAGPREGKKEREQGHSFLRLEACFVEKRCDLFYPLELRQNKGTS